MAVTTPKAVRKVSSKGEFRGLVSETFTSQAAVGAIEAAVGSVKGCSWSQMVEALSETMQWEYEGMK